MLVGRRITNATLSAFRIWFLPNRTLFSPDTGPRATSGDAALPTWHYPHPNAPTGTWVLMPETGDAVRSTER
jgi:hypothetical protein